MSVAELDRSLENSIKRSFLAVWRHKFVFLITSATVFSAVIVGCLAIQPIYEGSTLLIFRDAQPKPVRMAVPHVWGRHLFFHRAQLREDLLQRISTSN